MNSRATLYGYSVSLDLYNLTIIDGKGGDNMSVYECMMVFLNFLSIIILVFLDAKK